MAELVIFDDGQGEMGPLDDLRPIFALRTGGLLTAERIERALGQFVSGWWVRPPHQASWQAMNRRPVNQLPPGDDMMCVNGRWSGCGALPMPALGEAVVGEHDEVLATCLGRDDAQIFLTQQSLPAHIQVRKIPGLPVYRFAWDILNWLSETLADDLEAEPFSPNAAERAECAGEYPVSIDDSAVVFPGVVFDTHAGPIFIGPEVTIRPNAVLVGPCWISGGSTVSEGAVIRGLTVVGPDCRVGGEVGATIFQGLSNKVHDGYLGDSIVGSWVNLGADTVSSNLLNTYGEISVRLEPSGPRRRSGRMFLGAVIGDHVKTAIGTRLMTGCVLGTGGMLACGKPIAGCVPRFAWRTDDGERWYDLEKFIQTVRTVMARRGEDPSEEDVDLIRFLHSDATRARA